MIPARQQPARAAKLLEKNPLTDEESIPSSPGTPPGKRIHIPTTKKYQSGDENISLTSLQKCLLDAENSIMPKKHQKFKYSFGLF